MNFVRHPQHTHRQCRYFRAHAAHASGTKDFEISVYCDAAVFDWLLRYVKAPRGANAPHLTPDLTLPVLIASNFLQMEALVSDVVQRIARSLPLLTLHGADLASLADDLLLRIAEVRKHMYTHRDYSPGILGSTRCGRWH